MHEQPSRSTHRSFPHQNLQNLSWKNLNPCHETHKTHHSNCRWSFGSFPLIQVKKIRPFVVGAVLRNIKFNDLSYKAFINAQEKLHATFCRARKYASIGTHDMDKIKGPFKYVAKDPKSFMFVPLNQEKEVDGLGMMESLENHKLKEYLHLIRDSPVYPLVLDNKNEVCSVPPIINSEYSKISIDTKNVFIEVTALSRPKAMVCLTTLVWAFS